MKVEEFVKRADQFPYGMEVYGYNDEMGEYYLHKEENIKIVRLVLVGYRDEDGKRIRKATGDSEIVSMERFKMLAKHAIWYGNTSRYVALGKPFLAVEV